VPVEVSIEVHRCSCASYLCQGRSDGRDEETVTALSRVSHVASILALRAVHALEMCMASRWHRDHNGSGSHFESRFLKCRSRVRNTSLVRPLCRDQIYTRIVQGRRDNALEGLSCELSWSSDGSNMSLGAPTLIRFGRLISP
jgi:hypothetical protein